MHALDIVQSIYIPCLRLRCDNFCRYVLDYGGAHGIIVSILVGLHLLYHLALGYCDFLDYHLRKSWWGDEFYNEASSSVV